jgi:DNA repair protein RadA/Sms
MAKPRSVYACQACGFQTAKWLGRCPECGAWDSLVEELRGPHGLGPGEEKRRTARPMAQVQTESAPRVASGIPEFDRVLGGGVVPGSFVLVGGAPGIGKSTLLLQVAGQLAAELSPLLYVCGEESEVQVKLRAERLGLSAAPIFLVGETLTERALESAEELGARAIVVDSIQALFSPALGSPAGTVSQVRDAAHRLQRYSKAREATVFAIGHVTKDGSLAGPKVLEHVVDTVLAFEGDRFHLQRILRATKNRFGPANELALFTMHSDGLRAVQNPSALLLGERGRPAPGSIVTCTLQGSRPLLLEVQALVAGGPQDGTRRRVVGGCDFNRVALLTAVLERRADIRIGAQDLFVNLAGGLEVEEPGIDLAIAAAVVSSLKDRAPQPDLVTFGEVGLGGELRGVTQAEARLREALALGFRRAVVPRVNAVEAPLGLEVLGLSTLGEAIQVLVGDWPKQAASREI